MTQIIITLTMTTTTTISRPLVRHTNLHHATSRSLTPDFGKKEFTYTRVTHPTSYLILPITMVGACAFLSRPSSVFCNMIASKKFDVFLVTFSRTACVRAAAPTFRTSFHLKSRKTTMPTLITHQRLLSCLLFLRHPPYQYRVSITVSCCVTKYV